MIQFIMSNCSGCTLFHPVTAAPVTVPYGHDIGEIVALLKVLKSYSKKSETPHQNQMSFYSHTQIYTKFRANEM